MKMKISFRHMEHTPSLDDKIKEKCEKLSRFLGNDATVSWTCIAEKHDQVSEVHIHHKGIDIHATAHADDLYKTFDMCIAKLEHQLEKTAQTNYNKEKGRDSIRNHF